MIELDALVTRAINGLASTHAMWAVVMVWTSAIGVQMMVVATALGWWSGADRRASRRVLIKAGLSFLAGLAINQLIVLLVHRVRPYDVGLTHLLVAPSPDASFPSDHATAAFAIATAFLLHRCWRRGMAFLAVALLIAFSRVFIGIHYLGDVVGGMATGAIAAIVVCRHYPPGNRLERALVRWF